MHSPGRKRPHSSGSTIIQNPTICCGFFRTATGSSDRTQYFETSGSKCRVHPRTGHGGPEGEQRYSFTLSLTSAVDRGGWLSLHPGRFTPWNDRVPTVRDGGWAPGSVWTGAENLALLPDSIPGPSTPQRVAIPTELPHPTLSEDTARVLKCILYLHLEQDISKP